MAKEGAIFRKVGRRLLPVLCPGYLFSYIDRSNIGFAGLGMNQAIGLARTRSGEPPLIRQVVGKCSSAGVTHWGSVRLP